MYVAFDAEFLFADLERFYDISFDERCFCFLFLYVFCCCCCFVLQWMDFSFWNGFLMFGLCRSFLTPFPNIIIWMCVLLLFFYVFISLLINFQWIFVVLFGSAQFVSFNSFSFQDAFQSFSLIFFINKWILMRWLNFYDWFLSEKFQVVRKY